MKRHQMKTLCLAIVCLLSWSGLSYPLYAQDREQVFNNTVSARIRELMAKGDIPGLSIAAIVDNKISLATYGFADLAAKKQVSTGTLFEIGSCSKAFTALAALQMEKDGLIQLNDPVSKYLPWFYASWQKQRREITISQLLHHTSGIPFKTISCIPQDSTNKALENTVRNVSGVELWALPGTSYQYATINYDIVGLILQQVSGMPFEDYVEEKVLQPLELNHTSVGVPYNEALMSAGYKIGFFNPRKYNAPVFRGNYPAGYIVSDIKDMSRWLNIQMGGIPTGSDSLIRQSHIPDMSVEPIGKSSYAYGWEVDPYKITRISHAGNNPDFTAYVAFYPEDKTGVVVLANSNSEYTNIIAEYLLSRIAKRHKEVKHDTTRIDAICSTLSIILAVYVLFIITLGIYRKPFKLKPDTGVAFSKKLKKVLYLLLPFVPLLYGIYLIPEALLGFSWAAIFVWAPVSLTCFIYILLGAMAVTYLYYVQTVFLTDNVSKYRSSLLLVLLLSVLSGLANTAVLFLITSSFYTPIPLFYLLYYFLLSYGLYVASIKIAQTKMIMMTNDITFDIRAFLINKMMRSSFQTFEKLSGGRILTTLNNDTANIANAANVFITFITNFVTIFSAFIYMATISFLSTLVVLGIVLLLTWYFGVIAAKARVFMEEARSTNNEYMGFLNNMVYGFRELSLHRAKRTEFRDEIIESTGKIRKNSIIGSVKFLNSTIIGNSFIMIVLGILSILVPKISTGLDMTTLISFVMVLLYIIGPINAVLSTIQEITKIKVSWSRISGILSELGESKNGKAIIWQVLRFIETVDTSSQPAASESFTEVESIDIQGLVFEYPKEDIGHPGSDEERFRLGPIDLHATGGDVIFVVGGNGSGKSTFMYLVAGLYTSGEGSVSINGVEQKNINIGEYFSVILNGDYLFKRIYGVNTAGREDEIEELISRLKLDGKVQVRDNKFSTIDLSTGQRKRLMLLKCLLEDRPIFLFDEFAAAQDPEFRRFFYREIIPEIKKTGKIVIAITHDDHYFDVADTIIKLDYGQVDFVAAAKPEELTDPA